MNRFKLTLVALTAGVGLVASPAFAQRTRPADSASTGSAVARGSSAASSPAPSSPSPASSTAGSAAMPMSSGVSSVAASPSAGMMHRTPMAFAPQRRTAPRGAARTGTASPRPAASTPSGNRGNASEIPSWSRPHGAHPATGTAVQRTTPPPVRGNVSGYYYSPFYPYGPYGAYGSPYYGYYASPYVLPYYLPGAYGFGLDMYFDPWMASMGTGLGYPYGYGYDPRYGYDPYDAYGGSGYSYNAPEQSNEDQGAVRLKVKPRDAKVYVDGYLVGTVDQFDGVFQKLTLNSGPHQMEVRADGYAPETFKVLVTPNETVTYEGDLKKIQ